MHPPPKTRCAPRAGATRAPPYIPLHPLRRDPCAACAAALRDGTLFRCGPRRRAPGTLQGGDEEADGGGEARACAADAEGEIAGDEASEDEVTLHRELSELEAS